MTKAPIDLTAITTAFGLLHASTQDALQKAAQAGMILQKYTPSGWIDQGDVDLDRAHAWILRLKPGQLWPRPKGEKNIGYLNIYNSDLIPNSLHPTRQKADTLARSGRVACVRIAWSEGQFDDARVVKTPPPSAPEQPLDAAADLAPKPPRTLLERCVLDFIVRNIATDPEGAQKSTQDMTMSAQQILDNLPKEVKEAKKFHEIKEARDALGLLLEKMARRRIQRLINGEK